MKIKLKKFGKTLTSRDSGREAYKAIQKQLEEIKNDQKIILDFSGVNTFTPSWGDEFITNLSRKFGQNLVLIKSENPSVIATLELLSEIHNIEFNYKII